MKLQAYCSLLAAMWQGGVCTVNDLFADLAVTCMENNLSFDYAPHVGSIDIRTVEGSGKNLTSEKISTGYIKNWDYESPESTLNRMLEEVNTYLEGK